MESENEEKTPIKKIRGSGSCCSVASCKNTGRLKATSRHDIRFHRFPKDPDTRREWVKKCGRKERFNPDTGTVCSDHFTIEDYQRDLRAELLGLGDDRKKLLPDSVPHRNLPPEIQRRIRKRRDREMTDGEKIANRKKLVAEAIEWAESLSSETPESVLKNSSMKKNYTDTTGAKSKGAEVDVNSSDIQVHETGSVPLLESTPAGVSELASSAPFRSTDVLSNHASPEDQEITLDDFVDSSPVSSQINLCEDQSKWDKNTYARKYSELLSNYEELDAKYKRCYKVLCCFKVAYTKLRNQNKTAKNKITDLRGRNKNLHRELKRKEIEKKSRKQSKFVQTDPFEDDVNGWW